MPGARSAAAAGLGLCRWRPHCPAATRSPWRWPRARRLRPAWWPRRAVRGCIAPQAALGCLAVALVALFFVVRLADRTFLLPQAGLAKSPAVLADKAEQIIAIWATSRAARSIGRALPLTAATCEYAADGQGPVIALGRIFPADRPPAVCFWYRAGQRADCVARPAGRTVADGGVSDRARDGHGPVGRPRHGCCNTWRRPIDAGLSDAASQTGGLVGACLRWPVCRWRGFSRFGPLREPPMYADALAAWEGRPPENPQMPIRVEGASLGGRVVFFEVVPPWTPDWTDAEEGAFALAEAHARRCVCVLYLLAIIGGSFLAWHNVRRGRGDHRGAGKLVVLVLFLGLLDWLLGERHVADSHRRSRPVLLCGWRGRRSPPPSRGSPTSPWNPMYAGSGRKS